VSRPEGGRLLASGFARSPGLRASWRVYRLPDGAAWISVNGKCVEEGEALTDKEAIRRAEEIAGRMKDEG